MNSNITLPYDVWIEQQAINGRFVSFMLSFNYDFIP